MNPSSDTLHRNLMINFIPPGWTSDTLRDFFRRYGEIEECRVIIDKATGKSKGYGFVTYATRLEAESAIMHVHGTQVEGKTVKIQKAELNKPAPQNNSNSNPFSETTESPTDGSTVVTAPVAGPVNLYFSGFDPAHFGMDELQSLIAPYGPMVGLKVHPSRPGLKGVAFITLESWEKADAAVAALNGAAFGEDMLVVRIANSSAKKAGLDPFQPAPVSAHIPLTTQRFHPYQRPPMAQPRVAVPPPVQAPPTVPLVTTYNARPHAPVVLPKIMKPAPDLSLPGTPAVEGHTLFIYGVQGMDEAFLFKLFGQFGAISTAQAPVGKNYGFVKMPNRPEAEAAVSTLNGCTLEGATRPIQVSFKENRLPAP